MGISWLKTGAASAEIAKKEAEAQKLKQEEMAKNIAEGPKLFRFWINEGEDASITFVDGELSPDGFLLPPRLFEHNLFLNGKWGNYYVCPEKTDEQGGHKCPICATGDKPALIALFTIIDHRIQVSKKDKTKVYKDQKRLLVAKSQTFEMLNKIALKRGGLAGCTFDVSRQGDKSASVGSMFDFTSKVEDLDILRKKYTRTYQKDGKDVTETIFTPANYERELEFKTGEELAEIFGSKPGGAPFDGGTKTAVDYSNQL